MQPKLKENKCPCWHIFLFSIMVSYVRLSVKTFLFLSKFIGFLYFTFSMPFFFLHMTSNMNNWKEQITYLLFEELLISINIDVICFLVTCVKTSTDWVQKDSITPEISDKMCCCFSRSARFFGMYSLLTCIQIQLEKPEVLVVPLYFI